MSFILEALKKSEKQRTLGSVPTLDDVYHNPRQPRAASTWLVVVITTVVVAAVLAGLWLWNQNRPEISQLQLRPVISPDLEPATQSPPAISASQVTVNNQQSETAPAVSQSVPQELYSLSAQQQTLLRQHRVNVISYSDDPKRRFAMINQHIAREGDALSDQVRLLTIGPDAVIISSAGYRVILRP